MKKPITYVVSSLSVAVVILGFIAIHKAPAPVQKAEASWAPEAIQIVESIKSSSDDWKEAQHEYENAMRNAEEATLRINRAEAAGKGADLMLCSKFQARFDRTSGQLIPDASCPLL